jgi:3'-phosphoadenosine 5'-phosphosulfate sulfotransferase (PAPS reductase)/FAD synthetase
MGLVTEHSGELVIDPPAPLDHQEAAIIEAARQVFADGRRAVLGYSGGLESNLLLDLLAPWKAQITAAWVSARPLPHMPDYVRRRTAGWQFVELPSNPARFFRDNGLPALVIPAAHTAEGHADTPGPVPFPRIRASAECCNAVRMAPLAGLMAVTGADVFIHGQRGGEGTTVFGPNPNPWDRWGPLRDWTREAVEAAVQRRGIELPAQYACGLNSFECAICPAETDARRLEYLRDHYPDLHAETLTYMGAVYEATERALGGYRAALARMTPPAAAPPDGREKNAYRE